MIANTIGPITYFGGRKSVFLDQASSESAFFNGTYLGLSKSMIFQFPFKFTLILADICFLLC